MRIPLKVLHWMETSRLAHGGLNLGLREAVGEPSAEVSMRPKLQPVQQATQAVVTDTEKR